MSVNIVIVSVGSNRAVICQGSTVCTYDPQSDDAGCSEMLTQVAASLAAIHNTQVAEHAVEQMPDNWTWADVISQLDLTPEIEESTIPVLLNHFDDEGLVVDSSTMMLSDTQISDIVDHAAQLIILKREQASDDDIQGAYDELENALVTAAVLSDV